MSWRFPSWAQADDSVPVVSGHCPVYADPGARDQEEYVPTTAVVRFPDQAVVYLYLVNYGRARPEEITGAISGFLSVSCLALHVAHQLIRRTAMIGIH